MATETPNCQGILDSSKRCTICKDPAMYCPDEQVWRHKNEGFEGGQFLCDRYGYPIQVEDDPDSPAPTHPDTEQCSARCSFVSCQVRKESNDRRAEESYD